MNERGNEGREQKIQLLLLANNLVIYFQSMCVYVYTRNVLFTSYMFYILYICYYYIMLLLLLLLLLLHYYFDTSYNLPLWALQY